MTTLQICEEHNAVFVGQECPSCRLDTSHRDIERQYNDHLQKRQAQIEKLEAEIKELQSPQIIT